MSEQNVLNTGETERNRTRSRHESSQRTAIPNSQAYMHSGRTDAAVLELQRSTGNHVASKLIAGGHGERLPRNLASDLLKSFGTRFDTVRVHAGEDERMIVDTLGADALTIGTDIWLGSHTSVYDRRLLGHELAHVVQQTSGLSNGPSGGSATSLEHEAARSGEAFGGGAPAPTLTPAPVGAQAAGSRRPLSDVLKDPEVASRLADVAKRKRDVPGQVLEESLYEYVRTQLANPEGRQSFVGETKADVEFFEGYRIRDAKGRQLSDGMILSGKGKTRSLHVLFEAKLSEDKAHQLHNYEERRSSRKDKAEKTRVQFIETDPDTGRTIDRQSGGQFGVVRERLLEGEKVRLYSRDMKSYEEVAVRPTKDTLWVGVAPKGVSLSATEEAFKQHSLGLKYRSLHVPETKAEIEEAAQQIRKQGNTAPTAAGTGTLQVKAEAKPADPEAKTPVSPVIPFTPGPPQRTSTSTQIPEQLEFSFMKEMPTSKPPTHDRVVEIFEEELRAARETGRLSERGIEALWRLEPAIARYLLGSSGLSRGEQRRVLNQLPGHAIPGRTRVGGAGMLALQVAMDVAPIVQTEQALAYQANVSDAMADLQWWVDKGVVPSVKGVSDRQTPRENIVSTDFQTVLKLYREGNLDYLAITGVDEKQIETGFLIWATAHLVTYRDWHAFIAQTKAVKDEGGEFGKKRWSYRAGDVEDKWYGFDVTEMAPVPSAALTRILNAAATKIEKGSGAAIGELAKAPGPPDVTELRSERYAPRQIYRGLPKATGYKRFRSDLKRTRLFRIGSLYSLHDFRRDSRFYTFPSSLVGEVSDEFVVVGGADLSTYAQIYDNNTGAQPELMLALEEDLEDAR